MPRIGASHRHSCGDVSIWPMEGQTEFGVSVCALSFQCVGAVIDVMLKADAIQCKVLAWLLQQHDLGVTGGTSGGNLCATISSTIQTSGLAPFLQRCGDPRKGFEPSEACSCHRRLRLNVQATIQPAQQHHWIWLLCVRGSRGRKRCQMHQFWTLLHSQRGQTD